jgi:hypothetical protein
MGRRSAAFSLAALSAALIHVDFFVGHRRFCRAFLPDRADLPKANARLLNPILLSRLKPTGSFLLLPEAPGTEIPRTR